MVVHFLRLAGLALTLWICAAASALAQAPPLVFTVGAPERTRSETVRQASTAIEERGLAMWGGTAFDFGIGVSVSSPRWTIRSITSITMLPSGSDSRPAFQQIEIVRPVLSAGSIAVAGGGGIRQEWDGTRVLIGRVLAGSAVGRGRLQGSLVMERFLSSPARHDAADVVTSVGWSRPLGNRISVGVEGIGQDLEGLWDRAEVDGGAKLLTGPSLHVQSRSGQWAASLLAGPVLHPAPPSDSIAAPPRAGRHFGIFASATWVPAMRR